VTSIRIAFCFHFLTFFFFSILQCWFRIDRNIGLYSHKNKNMHSPSEPLEGLIRVQQIIKRS